MSIETCDSYTMISRIRVAICMNDRKDCYGLMNFDTQENRWSCFNCAHANERRR